jgi:pimeloyl-ACP methyl ester carboxylesterase
VSSRVWRGVLVASLLVIAIAIGGFLVWARPQPLLPEAEAALASTPTVTFTDGPDGRLTYEPAGVPATLGLVLYPGGKVPPAAYAPQAREIAAAGYLVVIVAVPLNLAVFDIDAAADVLHEHPDIRTWALGGHSLGGSMAAQFIDSHPGSVRGLVLWASYSAADLSDDAIDVASIFGTLDHGAPTFTSQGNLAKLGSRVVLTPIDGGNHEQMGWYTGQPDDPPATISRTEQQRQVIAATLDLLRTMRPSATSRTWVP